MKEKINDPEIAEILTPKGYPLFAKRPPLDHGFYDELIKTCKNNNTDFISTPFDIPSLEFLIKKGVNKQ